MNLYFVACFVIIFTSVKCHCVSETVVNCPHNSFADSLVDLPCRLTASVFEIESNFICQQKFDYEIFYPELKEIWIYGTVQCQCFCALPVQLHNCKCALPGPPTPPGPMAPAPPPATMTINHTILYSCIGATVGLLVIGGLAHVFVKKYKNRGQRLGRRRPSDNMEPPNQMQLNLMNRGDRFFDRFNDSLQQLEQYSVRQAAAVGILERIANRAPAAARPPPLAQLIQQPAAPPPAPPAIVQVVIGNQEQLNNCIEILTSRLYEHNDRHQLMRICTAEQIDHINTDTRIVLARKVATNYIAHLQAALAV